MLDIELPYDPVTPLLGIYPKQLKTYIHVKTHTQIFIAVLFKTAPKWKQHKCYQLMNE